MYIKHKSTIFKTKTDDFGRIKAGLNDGIKDAIFNGNFFKRQNLLSNSDITAIKTYNAEIDKCTTSQTAFYRTMQNTSKEAQNVVAAANGNKVVLDGLTKSSKAAELGMKALSMAGNMLLMWGISEAITIIYDLATASDRLQKSAAQLGSEFANTKSDIDGYKTKIEELYQTINNDTSSYEDTYNARQELLKIQDEMIEKFGDEAKAVDLVTDAINGQTDALDTLTQNEWVETVNAFNSDRDKKWTEKFADFFANIGHKGNNFQRMIDEMENAEVTFHIMPMYGDETYEEFSKKLKKDFGASLTQYERDDAFTLSGDLDDIYKQLLNIQNLAKDMDIDDTFLKDLGDQADEAKGKLEDYQEIYSQHVLYDKIFNSDDYEKSFDEINKAYEKYQDTFASGDEKAIEEAKQNYAEIVQGAIEGLDDQSVIDYFNNMYPDLQEIVGGWEFEVKFKAAVDNDKDDFENEVKDAVSQFNTAEDIKNYNPKVATEEQKDAYLQLEQYADDYGLTLDQLIDKLVQLGLLQSQAKSDLLNKLIPSKSTPTAGFASALTDAMDSVDSDEATKWIESLTEEEAKLANSKDFENALEEQKKKLNCASLSADDYAVALQTVKDKQNENSNETSTSFEIPDADTLKQQISDLNSAIDSIQSAYDTLNSAVEEYNSNGGQLSIDTIQSLLSLSDEYLACLQVENGQLSLNADAMAQLAQAKLDEAQATAVTQAMTELQAIANGEAAQSTTNYITGNAALMSSLAQLSGSYEGVAQAAMTAAQAQRMSALISDAAGKDKTATENVMKGLDTKLKLIQTTKASINAGNFGKVAGKSSSSSKGSGSGKPASDTAKEEIEAYMEYLEKALEGGRITYSDYVRDVTLKLDDMYHNGRITAKEYFDYVEKRLNQQLEVYKSVLSAVTDLLEDEAQKWQDKIDALNDENDLLEKQKDDYDSILSAVDQVYQDEIDRLNEQKDLLQDKIDAINDENDALELQRKKQEALIALDKARQQRNVKIYTEDRGYFYSIDQDAYKDAQQNLQDIKNEEVIKKLEDEQDALDDSIELLEKYRDLWNDIADAYKKKTNEALAVALWGENYEKLILQNRTQDIEAFKDKYLEIQSKIDDNKSLIDSYQEKVDYYNKLKEQWSDISSAYEKEQQRMYAAQILGANWEKDVLDGRLDVLSQFRDQYLEIQRQMTQAALDGARARNDAAASGGTGGSGGSSGGGGGSTPIQNQQAYHVLHLVGGYSTSGEASSKISSFNGKGVYKYKDGKWYVYKEEDYSNLSFGSKSEADDYIKKHLSPAGKFLVKYYHNGLENGLVDFSKKDSNFNLVQKYGLKKYEVPAILKQGEAVMNQEQIKNLGEALRAIPTAATLYTTPDYTKMLSSLKTNNTPVMVTQSVNITLPNVTNNSGYENLTRELNRLKLDAYQFANRRN